MLIAIAIGWREALVTLVVIPTTILLTLFAANLMGYTINRVSLFALIFSIGILVDDAIVVVENIARHWAMQDGRPRVQATIEAVAEVGNPTIVATLTVVAALLPMLFVSGLMGPYMAPIPANASAAMLFSFFVAMVVAPWLMLRLAPNEGELRSRRTPRTTKGVLGRIYRRFATPIVREQALGLDLSARRRHRHAAVVTLFATKSVTVKLLPFDNKSEIAVVVDLPRGREPRGHRTHAVRRGRYRARTAGDHLGAVLCRHPGAVQFQRPCAALLLARKARTRRSAGQSRGARRIASGRATTSRSTCASACKAVTCPAGHQHQGGRGAARAAGAGDAAG